MPKIFVFSDDLEWCKSNFHFDGSEEYISHSYNGYKDGNYLLLMSACKYFIISNSTYSWWAAWLGNYQNKIVIAPKLWFNDPVGIVLPKGQTTCCVC